MPPDNGDHYVSRHEWAAHVSSSKECQDQQARRIRELEDRWNRYAGPVVLLLGTLTVIATIGNLLVIFGILGA